MRSSTTRASISLGTATARKGLSLCLLLAAGSCLSRASAQAPAPPALPEASASAKLPPDATPAIAELFVNGESRGNVDFFLDSSQRPLLPPALLRSALTGRAKPEIVDAVASGEGPARAEELAAPGILLEYDPNELRLSLTVPPRCMLAVDLGAESNAVPAKGEAVLENARFAAMLGIGWELDPELITGSESAQRSPTSFDLSPAIRAYDFVAEGDGTIVYDAGVSTTLYSARLVRDFPALGARSSLGIVDSEAVGFQSPRELLGAGFAREDGVREIQRGYRKIVDEFILERSADVTVEVNGTVVRRIRLPPGSYRLSELPLSSGLNEVDVRIDEEGQEPRWVRRGLPFDSDILERGEADYAIALGADRNDEKKLVGSGYFAMGATQDLKLGVDCETGYSLALAGLSALWASPLGSLGAATALSLPYAADGGSATSFGARFYWRYFYPNRRYVPMAGAAIEFRGAGFTAPRDDLAVNPAPATPAWNLSAQASENLPWGGNVNALGDITLAGGSVGEWGFSLGATIPIRSYTSLYLSGGYDWSAAEGGTTRLSMLLSITTPSRRYLQYRQDLVDYGNSVDLAMDFDDAGRGRINASADNLVGTDSDRSASLGGRLKTKSVNLAASGRYFRPTDGSYTDYSGSLGASTNLVYADGCFGAANDFGSAIALVVPSPAVGKERIELRSSGGARTTVEGGAISVIPSLKPYEDFVAAVEMPDSPPEIRPGLGSIQFRPAYRSVTLVKVAVASSISVSGRLVGDDRGPRKNLSGNVIDPRGAALPIAGTFTDDEGVFECYGLSAGPSSIRWSDGSLSSFTVPEGDPGAFFDIGDVEATMPPVDGGTQ